MNKIQYLRNKALEQYNNNDYETAAKTGEILLREHWHNRFMWTLGYANDLYNLACAYDEMGNLGRAAELYSDSARQVSAIEGESRAFAKRLTNLAIVLGQLGVAEPAFFIHSQAVNIYKSRVGRRSPVYANSLYNLANAAADSGRRKEAIRYHLDALRVREKISERTGEFSEIINSLHSIAFLYESYGEYEKAASYAEAAMEISDDDDDLLIGACHYLASLYERVEKYEQALLLYDRVQEFILRQANREHSAYLNIAYRRANLLVQVNRPREALECHEEIRALFQNISGKKHIFYANCLRNMALLHNGLGEDDEAESLILESMKIRREIDDITADIIFLIRLYLRAGEREKALEALIYALMRSDAGNNEFSGLVSALSEAFVNAEPDEDANELMNVMEALNDKEKLAPIISKWTDWETS